MKSVQIQIFSKCELEPPLSLLEVTSRMISEIAMKFGIGKTHKPYKKTIIKGLSHPSA